MMLTVALGAIGGLTAGYAAAAWSSDDFLLALWSLTVFGFYALPAV
jgi:hypothetical protein